MTSDATPTVADAIAVLERRYPPQAAEDWDSVGLSVGDREAPVRRVLFAVDPLPAVIDEAIVWGADLLVTHHPLLLRPVHGVSTDTWKGRSIHELIRAECALFTAHTNADVAHDGVNDALAAALELRDITPLRSWAQRFTDQGATFVPELAVMPSNTGLGRIGVLPETTTLADFARAVAAALPRTPGGVTYFGDGDRPIRRVAVCGGAGDGLLADATHAGVDAFVTADLRHHPASEHLAGGGPALIDPGHWASEWPWLPLAASALTEGLNAAEVGATTVETRVSTIVTDPASGWVPSSD